MKIGICQFDIKWEDKAGNQHKISALLDSCTGLKEIDWLIFPEMTLTGFSMNKRLATLSRQDIDFFKNLAFTHSFFVSFGGVIDGYNKFITFDRKGCVLTEYSKIHLFSYAGEDKAYTPGTTNDIFLLDGFSVTPAICYDLRFPYLFWNKALNTDIYVVIANWPLVRLEHWLTLLKARAIENQSYVVGVNRIGNDPQMEYAGNSLMVDPWGFESVNCANKEGIFIVDLDKKHIEQIRAQLPVLGVRRNDIDDC